MSVITEIAEIFETLGSIAVSSISSIVAYLIITRTDYYMQRVENPITPVLVRT